MKVLENCHVTSPGASVSPFSSTHALAFGGLLDSKRPECNSLGCIVGISSKFGFLFYKVVVADAISVSNLPSTSLKRMATVVSATPVCGGMPLPMAEKSNEFFEGEASEDRHKMGAKPGEPKILFGGCSKKVEEGCQDRRIRALSGIETAETKKMWGVKTVEGVRIAKTADWWAACSVAV